MDVEEETGEASPVEHWTSRSPGEKNHNNHHARYQAIEFFAFPYQPYYARLDNTCATVNQHGCFWHVRIDNRRQDGSGECDCVALERFAEQDAAFKWAVARLKEGSPART